MAVQKKARRKPKEADVVGRLDVRGGFTLLKRRIHTLRTDELNLAWLSMLCSSVSGERDYGALQGL